MAGGQIVARLASFERARVMRRETLLLLFLKCVASRIAKKVLRRPPFLFGPILWAHAQAHGRGEPALVGIE